MVENTAGGALRKLDRVITRTPPFDHLGFQVEELELLLSNGNHKLVLCLHPFERLEVEANGKMHLNHLFHSEFAPNSDGIMRGMAQRRCRERFEEHHLGESRADGPNVGASGGVPTWRDRPPLL